MLRKLTSLSLLRRSKSSTDQPQAAENGQENHEDASTMVQEDDECDRDERSMSRYCPCFAARSNKQPSQKESELLISQWALNADEELSPRSSAWLYLAAVSLMGLGTFLVVEDDSRDMRTDEDTQIVAMFSTCFSISIAIYIGYRHRSVRNALTCDLRWIHFSAEFVLSVILFCLWCVIMSILLDAFGAINFATTIVTAADSTRIVWNLNLWTSAWLGYGIVSYLVGSLLLVSPMRKRGTWPAAMLTKAIRHRYEFEESRWTYWFMSLAFQLALSAFSLKLRIGDTCIGTFESTPFCRRSSLGSAVGLVNGLIAVAALLLYRLDQLGKLEYWEDSRVQKVWCIESCFSLVSLLMAGLNFGYGSSPGGPATVLGNMFVTSIVGVALSLMLCEQALDSFTVREYAVEEDASNFEQSMPSSAIQDDVEYGKRGFITPRLSDPKGGSSSSSSSSSEALHESIYPPDFGHDGADSSSYSLPEPAPIYASESSTTNYDSSMYDASRAESKVSANSDAANAPSGDDNSDSDVNSESGVDLCFQPDNDVSSIDCSIPSKMVASRAGSIDPDGYTIPDNYDAREIKLPTQNFGTKKRKNRASGRMDRNDTLSPVAEQKVTNTPTTLDEK